jgi:hypothetical protein
MDDPITVPKRPIEVSGTVTLEGVVSDTRVKALEDKVASLTAASEKHPAEWVLDVLKAILPGVVLAIVGYVLNDTVNHALQEHQLQIDAIKSMQVLTADLQNPKITQAEAQAKAAQLAAFGKYSVPFFVNVHEIGNEYGALGAEDGLRMVARSEPESVCDRINAVIHNRTGLYHWQTHLAALELIAEVKCAGALTDVKAYESDLDSLATLNKWVATPGPDEKEYGKVRTQVQDTVERLNRPSPPSQRQR